MKLRNIFIYLLVIGGISNFTTISASAGDYRDYYRQGYDSQNYTGLYGNSEVCDNDEFPRFSFDSRDRVTSHWMYRTNQFEIATLGCRIRKQNSKQVAFYQQEAESYLRFLKENRVREIYSINGQRLDPRAIKRIYFLPANGALMAEFEY